MKIDAPAITYALYARRSSDGEDKQMASIPAQLDYLEDLAQQQGLHIAIRLEESHSAKRPGRPVFGELIQLVENGKVNGILTWHPNRLSRNAIDSGILIDLMDRDKLHEIRTQSQSFLNTPDNKFLFGLFAGQAKLENDNKGVDVKRGLHKKVMDGIYPTRAPLGYLNDRYAARGNKTILPDPDRFDQVRQLFDWILDGTYTPPQIVEAANEKLGLRTKAGMKLTRSLIYYILHNPFYYGRFEYPRGSERWYDGMHKPMITKSEYDAIQTLLKKRHQPTTKKPANTFPYRGLVKCGECGAAVTAEEKTKRPKNGKVHKYIYYHCTKRVDPNCKQRSIQEHDLENEFFHILEEIEIPSELHRWAIKELKQRNTEEAENRGAAVGALRRQYDIASQKITNLINMRANLELTEEEFRSGKETLLEEKQRLQDMLADSDGNMNDWIDAAERLFDFAENARTAFEEKTPESKAHTLRSLGSNLFLNDKKLSIHWAIPFEHIRAMANEEKAISARFEPQNNQLEPGRKAHLYASSSVMLQCWVWYQGLEYKDLFPENSSSLKGVSGFP